MQGKKLSLFILYIALKLDLFRVLCKHFNLYDYAANYIKYFIIIIDRIDRVSHCGLLYKLRSTCVGRQFLSIVSEFLSDRSSIQSESTMTLSRAYSNIVCIVVC